MTRLPSTGSGSDPTYVYTQASPASTWDIVHGREKFPSVLVEESPGLVVEYDKLTYVSNNEVRVEFNTAIAGKAYLN